MVQVAATVKVGKKSIERAAEIVREGGVIVFPTDTVYGLGCDPFNESAVERVFQIKSREKRPVPVLCSSLKHAIRVVILEGKVLSLATDHWPGALTVVAPAKVKFPFAIHQGSGKVGVRVPGLASCVALIDKCGGYLVGTSANISGSPSSSSAAEASKSLGSKVDLILDGGTNPGVGSTIVEIQEGNIVVLRQGAVRI
jgi:L-threonylcarbamoyladenylate synthase